MFAACTYGNVAARLVAEIDAVLRGAAPTHENIEQLVYMTAFIHETMR